MLRIGFLGNEYSFTHALCRWLATRADLRLIVWTDRVAWPHRAGFACARVARRIIRRSRRRGVLRAVDEAAFYALYLLLLRRREEIRIRRLSSSLDSGSSFPIETIQLRPTRISDPELLRIARQLHLDALFAMCTDVFFPKELIDAPRFGSYLWHEGLTPEYRGLYSSFWALFREDYARIGCSLLLMTEKLDSGPAYVEKCVEGVDFESDWHSYLAHKSVLDSLPGVERFLRELEDGCHQPIHRRSDCAGYYSYPTASALWRIAWRRFAKRLAGFRGLHGVAARTPSIRSVIRNRRELELRDGSE